MISIVLAMGSSEGNQAQTNEGVWTLWWLIPLIPKPIITVDKVHHDQNPWCPTDARGQIQNAIDVFSLSSLQKE